MNRLTLIRGGLVLAASDTAARRVEILIRDGAIIDMLDPRADPPLDAEVVDAAGSLIIPGLVNAHGHGHAGLMKGIQDRMSLELYVYASAWMSGPMAHEMRRIVTLLGAAEMIAKGCTAVCDLQAEIPLPTVEGFDTIASAYLEAGMRCLVAPMISDRSIWQIVPGALDKLGANDRQGLKSAATAEALGERLTALIRDWRHDRRLAGLALAPTIPLHCSDHLMTLCARLSEEHGLPVHMHLAEAKFQAVLGPIDYGVSLTRKIDDIGLLTQRFTGAHCVWIDDADLDLMAARGATISHNPMSNLRLGTGIAPVRRMLSRGINVGIGTDSASSSDGLNLFEAMRSATVSSRVMSDSPEDWIAAREAFAMATEGGARIMGLEDIVGRIETGYRADLVFLDLNHLNYTPLNDPLNQVIYVENGSAVQRVMTEGTTIYRDGVYSGFDIGEVKASARDLALEVLARGRQRRETWDRLAPTLLDSCLCLARRPIGLQRRFECIDESP
jgi:5-methylthioadenosine/S-adenosylhomocysteine deaminase